MRFEKWAVVIGRFVVLSLVFLGVGCLGKTPPVQYYVLSDRPAIPAITNDAKRDYKGDFSIGVGPVEIPEILDRSQIVTRTGANRVEVAEFHRWGGSLKKEITETIVANLARLLGNYRIYSFPWRNLPEPDYRIILTIHQFDGHPGESVFLDVSWAIFNLSEKKTLAGKRSALNLSVQGTDYAGYVATQSRALSALSGEIAMAVQEIRR